MNCVKLLSKLLFVRAHHMSASFVLLAMNDWCSCLQRVLAVVLSLQCTYIHLAVHKEVCITGQQ